VSSAARLETDSRAATPTSTTTPSSSPVSLDLYEATFDPRWLQSAIRLEQSSTRTSRDAAQGGYFLTADDAETLLARAKPDNDGAEPAGNSIMLLDLLRLDELTGDDRYRSRAGATLRAFQPRSPKTPTPSRHARRPRLLARPTQGHRHRHATRHRRSAASSPASVPPTCPTTSSPSSTKATNAALSPPHRAHRRKDHPQRQAHRLRVCEQRVCDLPTSDPEVFARQLTKVARCRENSPPRHKDTKKNEIVWCLYVLV
jgi:uncharacterized protein YyaL (SSP411 family)